MAWEQPGPLIEVEKPAVLHSDKTCWRSRRGHCVDPLKLKTMAQWRGRSAGHVIGWWTAQLPRCWEVVINGRTGPCTAKHGAASERRCDGVCWGGQLPFWRIVPGNRDRKEEAGAGNCTHCPHATLLPWPPGGGCGEHRGRQFLWFLLRLEPMETRTQRPEVVRLSIKKSHQWSSAGHRKAPYSRHSRRHAPLPSALSSSERQMDPHSLQGWSPRFKKDKTDESYYSTEMTMVYNLKHKNNNKKKKAVVSFCSNLLKSLKLITF